MSLDSLFNRSIRLVRSCDGVAVYERKLNQNPFYFVTVNRGDRRRVLHVGTRKHCLRKFREYRPIAVYGQNYFTA